MTDKLKEARELLEKFRKEDKDFMNEDNEMIYHDWDNDCYSLSLHNTLSLLEAQDLISRHEEREDWRKKLERFNGKCGCCGEYLSQTFTDLLLDKYKTDNE